MFLRSVGEASVSQIVTKMQLTQPTVSYHLKQMEQTGLLTRQRQGRSVHYRVQERCPSDSHLCALKQINFKVKAN